jgi:predicted metalloprotease with PDZ domain
MRRTFRAAIVAACLAGSALFTPGAVDARPRRAERVQLPIRYTLSINDPASRYLEVRVAVPARKGKNTRLAMPAWAPGSYLIRDFGRHVYEVQAKGDRGDELPVRRLDKQTWEVTNGGEAFELSYRVYANELSVRTSYVDDRSALLNGSNFMMYVQGELERPAELRIASIPAGWRTHTSLGRKGGGSSGPFVAPNYDILVDSPLLMGEAEVRRFEISGTKFEYVFLAPSGSNADVDRLAKDAESVARAFGEMMGGFPFSNYSFLALAVPGGGGGLEHLRSTAFILRPHAFAKEEAYTRAAHLAAHEFFHAWNVKRIHDEVLGPFDYTRENYSDLLWFHEGITATMESRAMLRAGLISDQRYLDSIASRYTNYANRPGSNHTSIAELSRDAWIKGYKPAANHREVAISYYLKGDLIGVLLDLELRRRSAKHGKTGSLEGLFRRLWSGASVDPQTGESMRPLSSDDIVDAASEEAGESMEAFFRSYVFGVQALPLLPVLESFGIEVSESIPGFDPELEGARPPAWAGIEGTDSEVASLVPDSPAARAGLAHGDEVLYIDDLRVRDVGQLNERIREAAPGQRVRIGFSRRGRVDRRVLTLEADPRREWGFSRSCDPRITDEQKQMREAWVPHQEEDAKAKSAVEKDEVRPAECSPPPA